MYSLTKIGAVLMVIGIALPLLGVSLPGFSGLATVIWPEKIWYAIYPDGTETDPTYLTSGSTVELKAQIVYLDTETGIMLDGDPNYWDVSVEIPDTGETVKLTYNSEAVAENRYRTYIFTAPWTAPNTDDITLEMLWTAVITDTQLQPIGTFHETTYAQTISEPDGIFRVNGVNAVEDTTLLVDNPTLSLSFEPISEASVIQSVFVDVYKGAANNYISRVPLTETSSSYEATYTLPETGTYVLKGYISWRQGTIHKMSMVIMPPPDGGDGGDDDSDDDDTPTSLTITLSDLLNIVTLGGVGLMMIGAFAQRT